MKKVLGRNPVAGFLGGCAVLALVACSGGGGGSSSGTPAPQSPPPPPPPAPPANAAPIVSVSTSSDTPDEGRPFWIDVSGSTDADDDALTWAITQISGPEPSPVPLEPDTPAGDGIFAFRAPEVSAETPMEFEVTVSDGTDSTSETVTIAVQDIVLTPSTLALGETIVEFEGLKSPEGADFYSLPVGNTEAGIFGIGKVGPNGEPGLFRFINDFVSGDFGPLQEALLAGGIPGENAFIDGLYLSQESVALYLTVALEEADKVYIGRIDFDDNSNALILAQTLTVDAPCAAVSIPPHINTRRQDVLIGTRGNGLRIASHQPFPEDLVGSILGILDLKPGPVIEETGDFCFLGGNEFISDGRAYAYDEAAKTVRSWTFGVQEDPVEEPPFDVELPEDLDLVDVSLESGHDRHGVTAAFLLTNGQHEGHHELVVYAPDFLTDTVNRTSLTWEKGTPVGLHRTSLPLKSGQYVDGYLITLETAPYLVFVSEEGDPVQGDTSPVFGPINYIPAPLWTTSVRRARQPSLTDWSLVLTQTKTGKVTMIDLPPQ